SVIAALRLRSRDLHRGALPTPVAGRLLPTGGEPAGHRYLALFAPAGRHRLGHDSLGAAPMRLLLSTLMRWSITALLVLAAIIVALWLWDRYETAPWTRDGPVFADVVRVSPDVCVLVTAGAMPEYALF